MSLSQRVKDHRYKKGWGPDELAKRAEISRTALYQIESGKTELPRAGTLRRIAEALEIPIEALMGQSETAASARGAAALAAVGRPRGDWISAEGGPLAMPGPRSGSTTESRDEARFAVENPIPPKAAPLSEGSISPRERDLAWKLHELLASPLGEGIARIVEETYRLLPQARSSL